METLVALAKRVAAHPAEAEAVGRRWAEGVEVAGRLAESDEAVELAAVVKSALAEERGQGLVNLTFCGPALGGLGERDVLTLCRLIDEEVGEDAVARRETAAEFLALIRARGWEDVEWGVQHWIRRLRGNQYPRVGTVEELALADRIEGVLDRRGGAYAVYDALAVGELGRDDARRMLGFVADWVAVAA